jgi:hypothetical protein
MSNPPSRISSARRNAEALLSKAQKRDSDFKLEQEREREAMVLKTARLRELRLAKEAEERKTAVPTLRAARPPKPRRSKQT